MQLTEAEVEKAVRDAIGAPKGLPVQVTDNTQGLVDVVAPLTTALNAVLDEKRNKQNKQ
ncbi:hypothetical protein [Streptomyces johnsoniae]|uniref:Uncharacterized protein n=1 Tax=Streptomyces johnsoniae TaxID=3075532 RepID=A0ABU2SA63_9ACTN|nr:hypothetical protein [Streptomyces sp. DSM 41886]MDT0445576.1 hypothetical protein [Streptomyces sp. DSM 41886]